MFTAFSQTLLPIYCTDNVILLLPGLYLNIQLSQTMQTSDVLRDFRAFEITICSSSSSQIFLKPTRNILKQPPHIIYGSELFLEIPMSVKNKRH